MTDFISHFPRPSLSSELAGGDLFTVSFPRGLWVCLRVTSGDRNAALVLSSYDPADQTPYFVWMDSLPSKVGRIEGRVTVRPLGGTDPIPTSEDYATPGCLAILPDAEMFVRSAGRSFSRDHFSLRDGRALHYMPDEALIYPSWEMVLEPDDGLAHTAKPFARFVGTAEA